MLTQNAQNELDDYLCPITTLPMQYAVKTSCDHHFNAIEIIQWVNDHHNCPTCRTTLSLHSLSIDRALQTKINAFMQTHTDQANSTPANLFAVLGLSLDATDQEIENAYAHLENRYAPTRLGRAVTPADIERFTNIKYAYDALRDQNIRRVCLKYYELFPPPGTTQQLAEMQRVRRVRAEINNNAQLLHILFEQLNAAVMYNNIAQVNTIAENYAAADIVQHLGAHHKEKLNWLLVYAARAKYNDIAMALIRLGADINQYSKIILEGHARQFPCYFLDMLVYYDNLDLFFRIGLENFDLNPYIVKDIISNVYNKKINIKDVKINDLLEEAQKTDKVPAIYGKFNVVINTRLLLLSMFCYWLAHNNHYPTLRQLLEACNREMRPYRSDQYLVTTRSDLRLASIYEMHDNVYAQVYYYKKTSESIIKSFIATQRVKPSRWLKFNLQYYVDLSTCLYAPELLNRTRLRVNEKALEEFAILLENSNFSQKQLMRMIGRYNSCIPYLHRMQCMSVCALTAMVLLAVVNMGYSISDYQKNDLNNNATTNYTHNHTITQAEIDGKNIALSILVFAGIAVVPFIPFFLPTMLLTILRLFCCHAYDVHFGADEVLLSSYSSLLLADLHKPESCKTIANPNHRGLFFHNRQQPNQERLTPLRSSSTDSNDIVGQRMAIV